MSQVPQVMIWRWNCVVDHLLVVRRRLVVMEEERTASGGPLRRVEEGRRVGRGLR